MADLKKQADGLLRQAIELHRSLSGAAVPTTKLRWGETSAESVAVTAPYSELWPGTVLGYSPGATVEVGRSVILDDSGGSRLQLDVREAEGTSFLTLELGVSATSLADLGAAVLMIDAASVPDVACQAVLRLQAETEFPDISLGRLRFDIQSRPHLLSHLLDNVATDTARLSSGAKVIVFLPVQPFEMTLRDAWVHPA